MTSGGPNFVLLVGSVTLISGLMADEKEKGTYTMEGSYEGEHLDGEFHGFGTMTFVNGETFEGLWEGWCHGQGQIQWPRAVQFPSLGGSSYDGQFHNGNKHGLGTYKDGRDGSIFKGEWKDGEPIKGFMSYKSGATYDDHFMHGKKHGFGNIKYADGPTFKGEFNQDKLVKGVLTYPTGAFYDGEFLNGSFHGFGTKKWDADHAGGHLHGRVEEQPTRQR